ncbi:MAG TPA: diguanylate cyclase [Bryobacteraceae bacterium]|nr:diguanylate cyclase [Bryobacteraceae bacterium]
MTVLIADDSIISQRLLDAALRKWGYDVVCASDGETAWQILQSQDAPSMAILDWMMPHLTGPDVCRLVRLQQRDRYTYLLLLTARTLKEDLIEGMDAGADDYLTKPFDQQELQVRLRAGKRVVDLHSELLAAREALRDQATRDSLTRLWNRSSILAMLQRELARGSRESRPLGLALMDLDRFKSVNDTYGHVAGDEVLVEASRRMLEGMRPYDAIGRYGGEEFLILLPGCDEDRSMEQAERMRRILCATPVELSDGTRYEMTGSFGVTSAIPGPTSSAEQLIRKADLALYAAKDRGRNRVELYHAVDSHEFANGERMLREVNR